MFVLFIPVILSVLTVFLGLWSTRQGTRIAKCSFWFLLTSMLLSVVIITATMVPLWVAAAPLLPLALFLAIAHRLFRRTG